MKPHTLHHYQHWFHRKMTGKCAIVELCQKDFKYLKLEYFRLSVSLKRIIFIIRFVYMFNDHDDLMIFNKTKCYFFGGQQSFLQSEYHMYKVNTHVFNFV